ncbi:uncharacterized protein LOC125720185 isoform X1 [Brienomyrus brachyistius]|uniref:uncharacterized protein LOC125720185 isoform X1 n=1 Tax=Brienomyrus brachyistius TaxID=42636 RepID=UPI0020B2F7E0|nr:uncharacterized protein LOC125720185 isoform X1 [Brienomyrus brachyistius]
MTSGGEETNADDKGSASAFILSSETRETFRGVRRTEPATSTLFSTIMINTYNNSLPPPPPVPPPVPPRGSRQQPQPGAADSKGQVKGLYILIFLQFLVTSGMFFYLFWSNNRAGDMREEAAAMKMLQDCGKGSLGHQSVLDCLKISQSEGEGEAHSSDGQLSASGAAAHMKVEKPSPLSAYVEKEVTRESCRVREDGASSHSHCCWEIYRSVVIPASKSSVPLMPFAMFFANSERAAMGPEGIHCEGRRPPVWTWHAADRPVWILLHLLTSYFLKNTPQNSLGPDGNELEWFFWQGRRESPDESLLLQEQCGTVYIFPRRGFQTGERTEGFRQRHRQGPRSFRRDCHRVRIIPATTDALTGLKSLIPLSSMDDTNQTRDLKLCSGRWPKKIQSC